MNLLISKIRKSDAGSQQEKTVVMSTDVSADFAESILNSASKLSIFSSETKAASDNLENIIILKSKDSAISDEFASTRNKFINHASNAYGFVSKDDNAIVIVEDNHHRKDVALEGCIEDQAADTFAHELGHIIDKDLSSQRKFKRAYLKDLKKINRMLKKENAKIEGEDLRETLEYLKHYIEGVNFEDGISKKDITRTGLRENFAECFSTIVDEKATKINKIFSSLFEHTMKQTRKFVV